MEVGLPTCQIQESSTPESHVQMMRNMSKFWIKLGQVLKHSLSQTALGPLLSYSLWLKGLWLKAGTIVLMVLSHPLFLLGFSLPLLSPSFFLFALCPLPFRFTYQLEEHSKDHASTNPPRAPQDGSRHCPGCHLERQWTCVGSVPQDQCQLTQRKLLGDGAWGIGRRKPLCGFIIEMIHL